MGTTTTNLHSILNFFASKQNSALINFAEFCDYLKRYAQHHLEDQPELLPYVANVTDALHKELAKLTDEKKVLLILADTDRKAIVVTSHLIETYTKRYKEIENNPSIPFPMVTDLPKQVPTDIFEKQAVNDVLYKFFEKQSLDNPVLYGLSFPRDLPIVLFPSSLPILSFVDIAIGKIRHMLRKEEFHDYFLKKIRISNPGKELSAKNFFTQIVTKPTDTLESLKTSADAFYFWNQLCYFIRQDYEKVKDYTQEDISVLQAIQITEIAITYFKTKVQQDQQRANALKALEQILSKPPYYFNNDAISRFVDSRGIPLLGQYSEQDLHDWLHSATTSLDKNDLPSLLVFKLESEQRFFIYKNKVIPLIVRLASDARDAISALLVKEWFALLKEYEPIPAQKDQKIFEQRLEQAVRAHSPVLYALLTSNFLPLVHYETRTSQEPVSEKINLFVNGKLIPYSELLMLNRQELLTDAKIMLPFWYTVPVLSWLAALLFKKPKKRTQQKNTNEAKIVHEHEENTQDQHQTSKKKELKSAAIEIERKLVPEGSTLEEELKANLQIWNKMINKQSRAHLTEDVNSLIRDYMRKVLRTIRSSSFTADRIKELSQTLINTPSLEKIRDRKELDAYVQLFMIQLVKNIK